MCWNARIARTRTTITSTPKGEQRREAILAALEALLAEQRFSDIQIAQVAQRAGVTRSGFYFYFPTKAAAVGALLAEVTDELLEAASPWYDGDGAPEPRLRAGFAATVAIWRRRGPLFVALLDSIGADRDAATLWQQLFDEFTERIAARVEADAGPALRAAGAPSVHHVAVALAAMAFAMMERDVRTFLRNGTGQPDTEDALVFAYHRLVYGANAMSP